MCVCVNDTWGFLSKTNMHVKFTILFMVIIAPHITHKHTSYTIQLEWLSFFAILFYLQRMSEHNKFLHFGSTHTVRLHQSITYFLVIVFSISIRCFCHCWWELKSYSSISAKQISLCFDWNWVIQKVWNHFIFPEICSIYSSFHSLSWFQ